MIIYEVYTDGSATVNTKPGGYGWVIVKNGLKIAEGNGTLEKATNNDAELESAIQGLVALYKIISNSPLEISSNTLVSDSQIILGWADGSYKFKQASKIAKYNALKSLVDKLNIKTRWVKGHSGDEHNERCDYLANIARQSLEEPKTNPKKERKIQNRKLKNAIIPRNLRIEDGVMIVNYRGKIKKIDLTNNTVEDYNIILEESV